MSLQKVFDGEQWITAPWRATTIHRPRWRAPVKPEFLDGHRVYKSKLGLRFCVSNQPRPGNESTVFFSMREYAWVKEQKLEPEEFSLLWKFKHEDWSYCPIPEEQMREPEILAKQFGGAIIEQLRGRT